MSRARIRRSIMVNGVKRWVTASTEQEYAERVAALFANPEKVNRKNSHTFRNYANNWFTVFHAPNVTERTRAITRTMLDKHIFPIIGDKTLEEITPADIQSVYNSFGDAAKGTLLKARQPMHQIFNRAVEDGIIARNPVKSSSVVMRGRPEKETEPYSVDEMRYIVAHIADVKNPIDRAFIALQALHPLRLEETLGLCGGDIDMEHNVIRIHQAAEIGSVCNSRVKEPKTPGSVRTIPLVEAAKRYIPNVEPDKLLFGGNRPYNQWDVKLMRMRITADMGLDKPISARRFRATVLTDIYDETKDIKLTQRLAGHATPNMTLRHYVKGRQPKQDAAQLIADRYSL